MFSEVRRVGALRRPYNGFVLGETIRQLRYEKGWSVLQLSKRSGVPKHLIEEIESGHPYVPSEANTALLAEALRVSVGLLLAERERLVDRWYR